MNCFRYKMEHDYGFAPNPFHGTLSLATCRDIIRKNKKLKIGDWIVGLGSVAMDNEDHIIFVMKVDEILTYDQYWNDPRFECKKPILNGSIVQMYGDNVYHTDSKNSVVIQEQCAHSNTDGSVNEEHKRRDIRGNHVLLAKYFYYFGDYCPSIPEQFSYIKVNRKSRGITFWDLHNKDDMINDFIEWLSQTYQTGIHGDPCNWKEYHLPKLNIYDDDIK